MSFLKFCDPFMTSISLSKQYVRVHIFIIVNFVCIKIIVLYLLLSSSVYLILVFALLRSVEYRCLVLQYHCLSYCIT